MPDRVLVDTNILVRTVEPGHGVHALAIDALAALRERDEPLWVTAQIIAELWSVMTRPQANNGLGFAPDVAKAEVEKIEELFGLLGEVPEIYDVWKRLVVEYGVVGRKVFDVRLVAVMRVHGIERILTFDAGDFARYGIAVLVPGRMC